MQSARKRSYKSATRREQAAATRQAILDGAREEFRSSGYSGSTIEAIAGRAGVATQTVYASFGSKRGVLRSLVLRVTESSDLGERYTRMMARADPRVQLVLAAELSGSLAESDWDVVNLLRGAGRDGVEALRLMEDRRLDGARALAGQLEQRGELREDLTAEVATDILWMLNSTDLYRSLVVERGWERRDYELWLAGVMKDQLLRPEG